MARRGQRLGLLAAAAGTIGVAVVALVLVIGLQQETARVSDALASRTAELGDLRVQVVSLENQLGDQGPAAATSTRLASLEAQLAALEGQLGDQGLAAATTTRLTSLEDRVVALENATTAPAGVVHPVITARHFQLVDDRGQELAVLGVDQVGFPELRLVRERESLALGFDADGPRVVLSDLDDTPRIRLGFAEGNRPSVSVHDASAAPRVEMVDTDENIGLRLKDATGQERAALVSDHDGAALRLNDATQVRAILVGHTTGGSLSFLDDQRVLRTTLGFTDTGGVLAFFDEHETTRVSLFSTSDAGELAFRDEHATERAALVSSPAGPALNLKDAQGTLGVTLRIGDAVRVIGVADETGNPRVTMGVMPQSAAFMLLDDQGTVRAALRRGAEGRVGLNLHNAQGAGRVHLSVVDDDPTLILTDENQKPRAIMGFDPATLAPIFHTRDAEGNETWRSGPAGNP